MYPEAYGRHLKCCKAVSIFCLFPQMDFFVFFLVLERKGQELVWQLQKGMGRKGQERKGQDWKVAV